MSYENIRLDQGAFCVAGEYFYAMQGDPSYMLVQKTSNGDPVMTYPFSHEVDPADTGEFLALQYDGVNFWSLEKRDVSGEYESERILRRWRVENYACVLKDSWRLRAQGSTTENINGSAFAVESYYNTLSEACGPGTSNLDRIKLTHPTAAFYHVTDQFHLQSATEPETTYEDIAVATTPDAYTVTTTSPIGNVYYAGDQVRLRRDLYFFNNEAPGVGSSSAAVYHFAIPHITASDPEELQEPTYRSCHISGIYENTQSADFITTSGVDAINDGNYTGMITYVRGMQMLMKRPNMPAGGLTYPGGYTGTNTEFRSNIKSMLIDNALKNDRVTLHDIYDLSSSVHETNCISVNMYRLQRGYTYGAIEGSWSTYNYVVSVLEPMVTSVAVTADPALVVANGVDRAHIYVTVRDQYGEPMDYKRVVLSISAADDDTKGYFLCPDSLGLQYPCVAGSFTWLDATPHQEAEIITGSQDSSLSGQVVIEWRAGTKAGLVSIVATVQP